MASRNAAASPTSAGCSRWATGPGRGTGVVRLISATSLRRRRMERRTGAEFGDVADMGRSLARHLDAASLCRRERLAHACLSAQDGSLISSRCDAEQVNFRQFGEKA